jgi:hypothetical protein
MAVFDGGGGINVNQLRGNISDVARVAAFPVGVYTVTFQTPMPSANHAVSATSTGVVCGVTKNLVSFDITICSRDPGAGTLQPANSDNISVIVYQ